MNYTCSCGYSSNTKANLIRHARRKGSICVVDLDSIKKIHESVSFTCDSCNATFKHVTSLNRHMKKCKGGETEEVTIPNSNYSHINGNHNSNTQNIDNSVHNVHVTINIQSFDEFTPDGVKKQNFKTWMREGCTNVILESLKEQQFNEGQPEKMNVFISNLKDRIARVYDGSRWMARDGNDVANNVFQKYTCSIQEVVDECEEEMVDKATQRLISIWNKNMDKEQFENHAKQEILLLLYNLRNIVKNTHNVTQRS